MSGKTLEHLLANLRTHDVKLWVENDKLRLSAPKGALSDDLRAELSRHKEEILRFLNSIRSAGRSDAIELVAVPRTESLPVSFSQQRLWFLNQFEPGNPAYNIPGTRRLKGVLRFEALQRTLDEITRRHETLRTSFATENGRPIQVVGPALPVDMPLIDLSSLSEEDRRERSVAISKEEAYRPFDLEKAPLFRARLLRLGAEDHVLLTRIHHIIADEWSLGVFNREVAVLYEAFGAGEPSPLPELPIQYGDYAHWQRRFLSGDVLKEQLGYWKRQLSGNLPVLALPTDRPRPRIQTFRGAARAFSLTERLTLELNALSQREGVTLFMTLLASLKVLLYHYTGQEDIIVGTPIANRRRAELENLIGFFVNNLPIRTNLEGNPTFRELLSRLKEVALEAFAHQDVPFEKLVEELAPERDPSQNPIFQMMFILQNTPREATKIAGLTAVALLSDDPARMREPEAKRPPRPSFSRFDLTIDLKEWKGYIFGGVEYNTDLFDDSTIQRLIRHFGTILERAVRDPGTRIADLSPLTDEERRRLVVDWNQTDEDYPGEKTIPDVFEARVSLSPERVALIHGENVLSYRELDRRANRLAHRLKSLGVGPEAPVGIFIDRSPSMIVGLLGILKAGGAYVPLDPAYPTERIAFMIENSRLEVLVTRGDLVSRLPAHAARVVHVESFEGEGSERAEELAPERRLHSDHPCYTMYTSGSTGTPKGVLGVHRAALNRFQWMWNHFPFADGEVCCQKTSLNFVDSVWEIFGPLLAGVPLAIVPDELTKDPRGLVSELERSGVSRIVLVPSLLRVLLESQQDLNERLSGLSLWIVSGEALTAELAALFHQRMPGARLVNLYGSSEVAADSTWYDTGKEDVPARIPIGRPIANTRTYLLSADLEPVPLGVTGELYVGGAGLARGYAHRPDWTAERFLPNPFAARPGERLYRTGDRARYRPDSEIEYMGRADHQVKIRGFRIELGEIGSALGKHPKVAESLLMVREDSPSGARLVAYAVPAPGAAITGSELREFLSEKLPAHMVPQAFVILEAMPLTPNGKVNRRALPAPSADRSDLGGGSYVAPRSELERKIVQVWQEVLGVERVGVHDNYFDLGGHSLLMVEVHEKLRPVVPRPITIVDLFQYPTVRALYKFLSRDGNGDGSEHGIDVKRDRARRREELVEQRKQSRRLRRQP